MLSSCCNMARKHILPSNFPISTLFGKSSPIPCFIFIPSAKADCFQFPDLSEQNHQYYLVVLLLQISRTFGSYCHKLPQILQSYVQSYHVSWSRYSCSLLWRSYTHHQRLCYSSLYSRYAVIFARTWSPSMVSPHALPTSIAMVITITSSFEMDRVATRWFELAEPSVNLR